MKKVTSGFNAFLGAIITTLIILVCSFLYMLFSGGADTGKRTIYFDTLFFSSIDQPDGSTTMNFGVENFYPAIITVVVFTLFYLFVFIMYKALKQKQLQLKNRT